MRKVMKFWWKESRKREEKWTNDICEEFAVLVNVPFFSQELAQKVSHFAPRGVSHILFTHNDFATRNEPKIEAINDNKFNNRTNNPTCEVQLKDVSRPTKRDKLWLEGSSARAYESKWCECARYEGEPRESEWCVRTKCDTTRRDVTPHDTTWHDVPGSNIPGEEKR